ncbi:TPA: hypothetical protein HA235_03870 [Candidatus Woesearchaeota archaeon]|nr:hypothetical protein [uncultured archaeon]MBS3173314.1 endonuclease/exonuclease/phosphatase family protein [Candidatus Woesearchaeota archaeon]HIH31820.1 hypothetical protein [Candidatus Woesearchaeota archaeon]HIH55465.1 hypothetical protein [Candidatus Woesearchaeota archaeon]HIJ01893.1 hypothetical protein [Candidatus Woesearchaeota archaeon]
MEIRLLLLNFQQGAFCKNNYDYFLIPFRMFPSIFYEHSLKAIDLLSKYLIKQNIDIAFFTELDGESTRTIFKQQLERISESSNINNKIFFPTYKFGRYIDQGNGILSKFKIISSEHIKLPGNGQARFLSGMNLKIKNKTIKAFITHLSLSRSDRKKQIDFIANHLQKEKYPIILSGDFNTESIDELMPLNFLTDINKYKTYPSWNPKKAYDHIFMSKHFKLKYISPANELFSDHVGLELELKI